MAEIVTTRQTVTRKNLVREEMRDEQTRTTEITVVRSLRASILDVSVLRNLVAALDEAAIPGRALVTAERSQEGHLVQLTVRHEMEIAEPNRGGEG